MKITIVLPVYNESKTIGKMLTQLETLPGDWEILFADGGAGMIRWIGSAAVTGF